MLALLFRGAVVFFQTRLSRQGTVSLVLWRCPYGCSQKSGQCAPAHWHIQFLQMLPAIRRHAQLSFRNMPAELRAELVQEAVANSLVAFHGLLMRNKLAVAYASALARFAVAQIRAGRRVGAHLNVDDVSSTYAQRRKAFRLQRLDTYDAAQESWRTAVIEDRRTPVDEQAAFRVDFPAWLAQLSRRERQLAEFLCKGHSTSDAARRFRLTAGRVSQLRHVLFQNWQRFHGGPLPAVEAA